MLLIYSAPELTAYTLWTDAEITNNRREINRLKVSLYNLEMSYQRIGKN